MGKALQALLVAVSLIMGLASAQSMARDLTVDQKFTDFRFLVSAIQSGYGPLEYKMTNKVVDYVALNSRFEQAIRQTTSNQDFYYLMVEYVSAYRDGHFHIRVPTSRAATLPLDTDLIDGKVLILKIDRQKLSEEEFPFALGDEVISLDGRPVLEYLNEATKYITSGNEKTRLKVAAWTVFHRNGRSLPVPSAKSVTVEIRRGTSQVIESVQLDWEFKGQDAELPDPADIDPSLLTSSVRTASFNYDLLTNDLFDWYAHPSSDAAFSCSGDTRITIPSNATVIMKSPFVAYYHPTEKGNIGYLRIPHYYPRTPPGGNEVVTVLDWVEQYRFAIRELQKNTAGLIIDQDHNCGGSVWIVNKMIAMFMDKPFVPSQFELLANKESYLSFEGWMNMTSENTIERENIKKVLALVLETWTKGTSFLTPKISIDGEEVFDNDSIHYTKPVVILIDEMAGSGGDMFPSMMQGLGRAKLFGQRTAGLGGHINRFPAPLPYSQMSFFLTKSLFYRPDGVAIENNGAAPDYEYVITRDDVLYGFKGYQKAYLDYLKGLL